DPVFLDATRENGFMPDLAAIPARTLERTALFYLCSPANPQGTVASLAYLQQAIRLARQYDFVLAVDECYAEIYDRVKPPGALEACAALGGGFEQVVVFHSLSKRASAGGLRSGFIAGDPALIARFSHLRSYGGGDRAVARRGAGRGKPRQIPPQVRHRRGGDRRPPRLLPPGRRIFSLARG